MFKKTMTFDDLDGNPVTQSFYFNYNKKEIAELLEFKQLEAKLDQLRKPTSETGLTQAENNQTAYNIFQDLILDAFGKKGDDNVTFVKTPELRAYWASHVAFVEMIFEFIEFPDLAASFVESCLPAKEVEKAKAEMLKEHNGELTPGTLMEMSAEADRRQQDPATRIETGVVKSEDLPANTITANNLVDIPGPVPVDTAVAPPKPAKKLSEMNGDDIRAMSDEDFDKLNVQNLQRDAMFAAFQRKNKA